MFSYGNAREVRDFCLHLFCQCKLVETTELEGRMYVPAGVRLSLLITSKSLVAQGIPDFMRNGVSEIVGPVGRSFFIVLLEFC